MFSKTSTAVYMAIAIVILLVGLWMSKPAIKDANGAVTGTIDFFNFKALKK